MRRQKVLADTGLNHPVNPAHFHCSMPKIRRYLFSLFHHCIHTPCYFVILPTS